MKKYYYLLLAFLSINNLQAQIIDFPDAAFKSKLLNAQNYNFVAKNLQGNYFKIDANNDGEIQVSEALQVSYLNVYNASPYIASMVGINNFINLEYLDCSQNIYTTLDVSSLVNLETLFCSSNFLASLTIDGLVNLKELNCGGGQLASLNVSGLTSLEKLHCGLNQITSIDVTGLVNLTELGVASNNLTSLDITDQSNLILLECGFNNLTTLNLSSQNGLESLSCSNNPLGTLNISNLINLKKLYCSNNQLVSLNVSNSPLLDAIVASNNQLTSFTLAGLSNLISLNLQFNQLVTIDLTGLTSLKTFDGSNNLFQTLDFSPLANLLSFEAHNNQLTSLNSKNGSVELVSSIYANPNLAYICADEEMIAGFQEHVAGLGYACEVNSYCSFTPGGTFYTISGSNKFDTDNNGCDAADIVYPNMKLALTSGTTSGTMISDASGQYTYAVQEGNYLLAPELENPTYYTVTPSSTSIVFPGVTSSITQNFCLTANAIHPDLEVVILPLIPARPGFDAVYKIIYKNKGNITQSGSVTFTFDDTILDYVSANPLFTTQETGLYTWNFVTLQPFETREIVLSLNLNSPLEIPAVNGGDNLNYSATISSLVIDDLPLDNIFLLPQIVVNSFDPNDKTCLTGNSLTPDMIGKYVHYMIRFENTGTFPAQNIVVKDMIDESKFDVSSLIALNGSHDYSTRITGNKVEFLFENINLPFEDATNDGYIVFKIKTLPTLALGDSFSNTASIYFDYNFPIVTEPAVTTFAILGTQDFVFNNYLTVYPNPASAILNLTAKQAIELRSIAIYNILGQLVLLVPNVTGVSSIDVSNLTKGNYFLKVVSDKGTSNVRFIKK